MTENDIPLLHAQGVELPDRPAPATTVYLVAAWKIMEEYWKVWPDLWLSRSVAEDRAKKLAGCWIHRRVIEVKLK
ncbi:MAG: hypothetical protein WC683_05980 [bacterium]